MNFTPACGICNRAVNVNHQAVQCVLCSLWIHSKCLNLSHPLTHGHQAADWFCKHCIAKALPFAEISDHELRYLFQCKSPSDLSRLPSLDILSKIATLPSLSDYDADNNLANAINSKYSYLHEVNQKSFQSEPFSVFHVNLNSLDFHFEELHATISAIGSSSPNYRHP